MNVLNHDQQASKPSELQITQRLKVFDFSSEQMQVIVSAIQTFEQLEEVYCRFRCHRLELLRESFIETCHEFSQSDALTQRDKIFGAWLIAVCQLRVGPNVVHPVVARCIRFGKDLDLSFEELVRALIPGEAVEISFEKGRVKLSWKTDSDKRSFDYCPGQDEIRFWIELANILFRDSLNRSSSDVRFTADPVSIVDFAEELRSKRVSKKTDAFEEPRQDT